jgi:hypothetical protein
LNEFSEEAVEVCRLGAIDCHCAVEEQDHFVKVLRGHIKLARYTSKLLSLEDWL